MWAVMGDKDVMTTVPMALLLTEAMLLLMPSNIFSAWKPAIIYLLLLLTLGYWLVGPMAIWAAMCLVAYALCRQKDKQNWAMGLVAVLVVGLFVQLESARMLPYPKARVFRGIDSARSYGVLPS